MNIHYDEKRKKYWTRITLGYNSAGRRVQKKVSAKTKRDLQAEIGRWIKQFEDGEFDEVDPKDRSIRFDEVAEEWLQEHVDELAVNTKGSYVSRMNKILSAFGACNIEEVTTWNVRQFLNKLEEEGLAPRTVNTYRSILSSMFGYAVQNKYVTENPVQIIKQVRTTKRDFETFSALELTSYLEGCRQIAEEERNYGNYTILKTAAFTGMRIGEVLALRWKDIDLEKAVIQVGRSLSYDRKNKRFSIGGTKNNQTRMVTISDELVQTLKWYKMQWMFLLKRLREEPETAFQDLIFLTITGRPKHYSYIGKWHKKVLRYKGLSQTFRVHDLRHTHATLLLELGEHPKVVQERLGHKDISVTMNMYTHVTMTLQRQTADHFGAMMGQHSTGEV